MDAKPQRPLRPFAAQVRHDENFSTNVTSHASKNSQAYQGNLHGAMTAGSFKGPLKRAAFGDLSNTSAPTVSQSTKVFAKHTVNTAKMVPYKDENKENAIKVGKSKEAFLRPAQRPSNGLKPSFASNGVSQTEARGHAVMKQTAAKKATLVYSDEPQQKQQTLSRQYRSQPYLRATDAPVLRRTQSKHAIQEEKIHDPEDEIDGTPYEDAMEELPRQDVYFPSDVPTSEHVEPHILQSLPASTSMDSQEPAPYVPEAEEYWDEEDDDDIDDEQGYTTAHSFKSHGDNTTTGATTLLVPRLTSRIQEELDEAKFYVEDNRLQDDIDEEEWDVSMVAEYGEEIFEYMRELESKMLPNPHYMTEVQAEIQWSMRSVLMDWLVQVHNRFSLLPETLFLTVNYIDRFLSNKMVSLGKLQLVGATAIFVAAKYEEINCPSVQEIVFMVDGGYTVDEILKAERFMLSMLQFELGWPGPMSFLRRISKADDYDLETRTLAKYFLEVTIMDERFIGCTPSYLSAGAHCLARLMLKKGDWVSSDPVHGQRINGHKLNSLWSLGHIHYSGYTWTQLKPVVAMLLECCRSPQKHHTAVYEKYADRRFKKASTFVEEEVNKGFALPFHHTVPRLSLCSASHEASSSMRFPIPDLILAES
ncbi:B-type cyclin [Diaporthe australafricana]|uniref:B-type cyclin n=1 Tax=Diaporthe australafricana TaxID=127596 RepID=A0ABR3WC46_9PEZI